MILGLNTNHEYNGKVYHVQTEDSGVDNPWIITHCFIGGTIINSRKTEYRDALGRDDLESHLTEIARAQHRGMIKSLLSGEFAKEILSASRGRPSRDDVPLVGDKGRGKGKGGFKPGGRANKLPGGGPPSLGPTKAVGTKRPPPLPSKRGGKADTGPRRTQSFGDTQVMDVDDGDLIEVEGDAELIDDGPLQFPSRLLRPLQLDPVTLAYLLEDDPVR